MGGRLGAYAFLGTSPSFLSVVLEALHSLRPRFFQVPLHFSAYYIPSSGPRPLPQDLGTIASGKNKLKKEKILRAPAAEKKNHQASGPWLRRAQSQVPAVTLGLLLPLSDSLPVAEGCQGTDPRSTNGRIEVEGNAYIKPGGSPRVSCFRLALPQY